MSSVFSRLLQHTLFEYHCGSNENFTNRTLIMSVFRLIPVISCTSTKLSQTDDGQYVEEPYSIRYATMPINLSIIRPIAMQQQFFCQVQSAARLPSYVDL